MPDLFSQTSQQTLNQAITGNQVPTLVETSASGASLVIWSTDTPATGTRARVVDSDGTPLGAEFTVPTGARGTLLANGDVAALYFDGGVKVQRYAVDGSPIGSPVTVAASGSLLDIELLASGNAVVTYASGSTILAQILDTGLALSGPSFAVGAYAATPQPTQSFVTALAGGGFVHLWDPADALPQFRVFGAAGNQVAETVVSVGTGGETDIDALDDGGFVVAGKGQISGLPWPFVQIFNSDGTARTDPIRFGDPDQSFFPGFAYVNRDIQVTAVSDDVFMATRFYDALNIGGVFAQLFHVSGREIGPAIEHAFLPLQDSSGQDDFVVARETGTSPATQDDVNFQTWSVLRDNIVIGTAAADSLSGAGGSKALIGFAGDDQYVVDDLDDWVDEIAGEGFDRISSVGDYGLAEGASIEHLTTTFNAGTAPINLYGNELGQSIYGNEGNNSLTGGGGNDVLVGLGGDDSFYLGPTSSDQVREAIGGGYDRVYVLTSYTLAAGQEIEVIAPHPTDAVGQIGITGNAFSQYIYGNATNNRLEGGGGGDVLLGLTGDDMYVIGDARDSVREAVGEGDNDRVYTSVSFTLTAGQELELFATVAQSSTTAINLTGNEFDQEIQGNNGANVLIGGGGWDIIRGYGGNDTYYMFGEADYLSSEYQDGGTDKVYVDFGYLLPAHLAIEVVATTNMAGTAALNLTGNAFGDQAIYGNAGNNVIGGGAGKDSLLGMGGADQYLFDTALNTGVIPVFSWATASHNVDLIYDFAADDMILLESDIFGLPTGALAAGAFNTGTVATQADDRVLYDAASRALLFDADGAGGSAAQVIAFLNNPFALDASHIMVV